LKITGKTPDENYVEIVEAPDHPWFLGCQFHPEFKSKPLEPHPLFAAFIGAALQHKKELSKPAVTGVTATASREAQHAPEAETARTPVLRVAPHATA
jgi:CTP synthase